MTLSCAHLGRRRWGAQAVALRQLGLQPVQPELGGAVVAAMSSVSASSSVNQRKDTHRL
jgi:hypothetical protein